jgi:hypothetical protein
VVCDAIDMDGCDCHGRGIVISLLALSSRGRSIWEWLVDSCAGVRTLGDSLALYPQYLFGQHESWKAYMYDGIYTCIRGL